VKDQKLMNRKKRLQLAKYGSVLDVSVLFAEYGSFVDVGVLVTGTFVQ